MHEFSEKLLGSGVIIPIASPHANRLATAILRLQSSTLAHHAVSFEKTNSSRLVEGVVISA